MLISMRNFLNNANKCGRSPASEVNRNKLRNWTLYSKSRAAKSHT